MENQHTIDTAERKSVPLPSILEMRPKKARQAWGCFMADRDWAADSPLYDAAGIVKMSIEEWILNHGTEAEATSRRNLQERLATFVDEWMQRRGEQ